MGSGTAWGGHLPCKQEISRVRFPDSPRGALADRAYLNSLRFMASSSEAERVTVNHDVAGSNPAPAAKFAKGGL